MSLAPKIITLTGFIDSNGKTCFLYDDIRNFSNGFACVKLGEYWGYINHEFNAITDFKYTYVFDFFKNGYSYAKHNNNWFKILPDGKEIKVVDKNLIIDLCIMSDEFPH